MITLRKIEWVAGFLEGEGSFQRGGSRGSTPVVSVMQVQREPLERLQALFGGSIRMWLRKNKNPNHSDAARWQACGGKAAGLMMTLYPLMSPKRKEQISQALAAWRAGRGEAYNSLKTHCPMGHEYNEGNTFVRKGTGYRFCRTCNNVKIMAAYYARKEAKKQQ